MTGVTVRDVLASGLDTQVLAVSLSECVDTHTHTQTTKCVSLYWM